MTLSPKAAEGAARERRVLVTIKVPLDLAGSLYVSFSQMHNSFTNNLEMAVAAAVAGMRRFNMLNETERLQPMVELMRALSESGAAVAKGDVAPHDVVLDFSALVEEQEGPDSAVMAKLEPVPDQSEAVRAAQRILTSLVLADVRGAPGEVVPEAKDWLNEYGEIDRGADV